MQTYYQKGPFSLDDRIFDEGHVIHVGGSTSSGQNKIAILKSGDVIHESIITDDELKTMKSVFMTESKAESTEQKEEEENVINRTSRGLVKELEEVVYNLMAFGDHLLDLKDNDLLDAMNHIEVVNGLRQELIASYSGEVDHRYHCTYKHALKSQGLLKEAIISAKRNQEDELLVTLLNVYDVLTRELSWVMVKYLQIQDLVTDPYDCERCLDDILLKAKKNKQS